MREKIKGPEVVDVVVIGAGPAACAAASALIDAGCRILMLDKLPQPGGLARTIARDGNRFDIGPHRYFTKSAEVLALWRRFIGEDFNPVDRLTRIFYRDRLINYPLKPLNALMGLGCTRSAGAVFSYLGRKMRRIVDLREPESFEDWATDQFGAVLYRAFFKTYTEKVWGISCKDISASWAAQRIKGLSLTKAILNALSRRRKPDIKTLAEQFLYPRLGAGEFCENIVRHILEHGGEVTFNAEVCRVGLECGRVRNVGYRDGQGNENEVQCEHVISSMPLTELVWSLVPAAPTSVLKAASALRYRGHVSVELVLEEALFPDNWIYVHSPKVKLGRVANYRSFSDAMCSSEDAHPTTVEYFVFPGDEVESLGDKALCSLAVRELTAMGLLRDESLVTDCFVQRDQSAYPVLERGHEPRVAEIRSFLETVENLWPVGRGGMFKYNNQDHSAMTGLLAARNVLGADYDIWSVNIDAEYHESGAAPATGAGTP